MRILLKTTKNKELIPFNYQPKLVSCLHKWLGKNNEEHGGLSLYSFSWLNHLSPVKQGLNTSESTSWVINFHDPNQVKKIIQGIQDDPYLFSGMEVKEVVIQETPQFNSDSVRFNVANPVFIKRHLEGGKTKFLYFNDLEASDQLSSNLKKKLEKAGLDATGVKVSFDRAYANAKTKGFEHNGIFNKGSICPVIVEGTPEQIAFAWNVGVGNSTGIGFGALV